MVDSGTDLRIKNKLEKQDEIEVSDEEGDGVADTTQRDGGTARAAKKGSPAPPSLAKPTDRLMKQASAPVHSERPTLASHVTAADNSDSQQLRKSSMPLAYVHIPEHGTMHHMRNELTAPRHLGSMAFSSMSTEESSISDMDRQMGMLSVQGSVQDEMYGGDRKKSLEDFAEFLVATWHRQPRDRSHLLMFEGILEELLTAKGDGRFVSPPLNSYYRMLLHRMADVWGFEHSPEVNKGQQAVAVKVLPESRRPDQLFRDMTTERSVPEETPSNVLILKRPKNHSLPETSHVPPSRATATMSFEERQANYDRVRQQIFGQESETGNEGEETPQPYGLPQNQDAGNQTQAAYNRSRSVQSDVSSDANYEQSSQMRPVYGGGDPYGQGLGRPMMQSQSLYGAPYGYAAGVMGYQGPDGSFIDPAVYQQMQNYMAQQQFYQAYGAQPQYHPQQPAMYPGMQFAQPGFAQPGYSPQASFDQMQQYDPSGQFAYQQQPPPALSQQYHPVTGDPNGIQHGYALAPQLVGPPVRQLQSPAQGYISPGGNTGPQAAATLRLQTAGLSPRFNSGPGSGGGGGGSIHHQSPEYTSESSAAVDALNSSFIIPLRFPHLGNNPNPSSQLGMFLKLPCGRPSSNGSSAGGTMLPSGGACDKNNNGSGQARRVSRNNSGRSSVDRQNSGGAGGGGAGGPSPGGSPAGRADYGYEEEAAGGGRKDQNRH